MKTTRILVPFTVLLALTGCGGGGGGSNDVAPPPPVSVTISPATGSLEVGDTLQFTSQVNQGIHTVSWYVNDVQGGNATVGVISDTGLYTAPASVPNPATVTVKGVAQADTTKSDTSQITISPKIAVSPTAAVVAGGTTQQFSANKPVSWFVDDVPGGNATVGTISAAGLYAAPASVPSPATVTVKAAWQANPAKTATAAVTITAATSVTLSPTIVTVAAGASQRFTAGTAVDWQLSGAPGNDRALGTIDSSGLYTAPSAPPLSGSVTVTAVSKAEPDQKAIAIVTISFSNASLEGHYALRLWGATGANPYFVVGSFVADGMGGISDAVFDFNDLAAPTANATFTASYSIQPDGRGTLNILYGTNDIGWRLVMIGPDSARLNAFGDGDSGSGSLDRQDPTSFSGGLSGPFVFAYNGVTSAGKFLGAAGMFTADGSVGITNGIQDTIDDGVAAGNVGFTGTYGAVDGTTGRGQFSITVDTVTTHYAYYMLSSDRFLFSSATGDRGLIGLALRQGGGPFSNASLSGEFVFELSGGMPEYAPDQYAADGRFTADGLGTLSGGTRDANSSGTSVAVPFTGTYTIDSNGQGYLSMVRTGATDHVRLYMVSPQVAFFVTRDRFLVASGQIRPQSGGPFATSSIKGTFGFGLSGTELGSSTVYSGTLTIDGEDGTVSGIADVNQAGMPTEGIPVTGTFTISGNGRGVASLMFGTSSSTMGMYVTDPQTILLIENDPAVPNKFGPALKQF